MTSFFGVPVDVMFRLISGLSGVLTPVLGGVAAVAAIIVFTMAVRAVLMPLSFRAMRGQAVQARLAPQLVDLPDEEAALRAEHAIRNYDPCISCATHFLKFNMEHG